MLALVKEVVAAIAVAKIVELPRLGCCEPAANYILIDEDFNGTEVASYPKSEVVGAGKLKSTDGVYGIRFAHNTEGTVSGLTMTKQ